MIEHLGVPFVWFPRLPKATDEQCVSYELSPRGIYWDALDEDISIEDLLKSHSDLTHQHKDVS